MKINKSGSPELHWVILDNDQLDALFLNVFIFLLHLCMFLAASAHHQEVQIVLIHHLV
jgi:hypothetical protein